MTSHRVRALLASAAGVLVLAGVTWGVMRSALYTPPPRPAADVLGMPAPSLALPSTDGGQFSLDSYRGSKVVVYFYEGAG